MSMETVINCTWSVWAWRQSALSRAKKAADDDLVDLMAFDSFPASDPPAYTCGRERSHEKNDAASLNKWREHRFELIVDRPC